VRVKAIACEFPAHVGEPLSRWSVAELGSHVRACGLTASLSDTTIWRWLNEDAIRPWQHRCWIFPRDPDFETKAGRILDLYHLTYAQNPAFLRPPAEFWSSSFLLDRVWIAPKFLLLSSPCAPFAVSVCISWVSHA
jgi:hypothetical protein